MKKLLVIAVALLLCVAIMSPALAEYGYTHLSQIPMAVDFTFRVDFDAKGEPHIVTDYPYKATGAEELNLTYNKNGKREAFTLNYVFATDETQIRTFDSSIYPISGYGTGVWEAWEAGIYKDLREGAVTLDDEVCINTAKQKKTATDWFLTYSISKKAYTEYEEKTCSQGFNAMGAGGVRNLIMYENGTLTGTYVQKRTEDGDLCIYFDKNGDLRYAYVQLHRGANAGYYRYNKNTGLFDGKKLSELGYDDNDINTPAPAALGSKRDPKMNEKIEAFVSRCYQIILGRDADEGGLKTWYNELSSGRKAAAEIIEQFVISKEFQGKKVSNADAVEILYKAMLGRGSDAAGKASWLAQLDSGKPLQAVINGFCGSKEFGNICSSYGIKPGSVTVPDVQPEQPASSDEQIQAYVTRCYNIILGRKPDEGGLKTWVNELNSGRKAAAEIIEQFVISNEFQNKKVSNADAVEILYKAMLGRGSDAAGKASWVSQLESGKPLQAVINGFCGSKEFGNICKAYGINPGTVSVPETQPGQPAAASNEKIQAFVSRCYKIILGRDADEGGMNTWSGELASGRKAAAEIIEQFVASTEFQNKKLSNPDAVEILYKAMLGRGSDAKGKADWVGKLSNGQPLTAIINGFCGSTEFKAICDSYGIKPGTVNVGTMKAQAEETLSGQAEEAAPAVKKTTSQNVTKVEIVNASETVDANLGTAVQAIYVNEEKAKEFIGRCYRCILGREASASELESWINQMLNGSRTPDQIARGFLFSGEFESRNVGSEELVKILYRVYMNREADAEGLATWKQKLDEGTSLQDLLNTFSRTGEFKAVVKSMEQE